MALTPETLPRHELVGLPVRVADATSDDYVGIRGRVVSETMRTLRIEGIDPTGASRVRQVPKAGTTFEFALEADRAATRTDETADAREGSGIAAEPPSPEDAARAFDRPGGEVVTYVTVDGARLLSRPATRTETTGDSRWR